MDHPFEHRAHYRTDGTPCHCPWGRAPGHEHLGATKEASKLQWLEERPDMQSPEGEKFLNFVKGVNGTHYNPEGDFTQKSDKLLPWLAREWKKKRLTIPNEDYNLGFGYQTPTGSLRVLNALRAADIQKHLEEMQKRGKGLDIMQHKVHELMPKVKDFEDWKKSKDRENLGEVLHRFPDGWTVRRLQNWPEHEDEGELMGHCVGTAGYGYEGPSENGEMMYVSLRDPKNLPHATMEVTPDHWMRDERERSDRHPGTPDEGWFPRVGSRSEIQQFYGKEDSEPLPEYTDRFNEWLQPHGLTTEGTNEDAEYEVPGARDVREYLESGDGGYFDWAYEDPNARIGENTDIFQGPHAYNHITNEYLHPGTTDEERRELFDTALRGFDVQNFDREFNDRVNWNDPEHIRLLEQWNQWKDSYYHPYTGEFQEGGESPLKKYQPELFRGPLEGYLTGPRFNWQNMNGERVYELPGQPIQGPHTNPYRYWQDTDTDYRYTKTLTSTPLYYRWIFSPTKGVTLGTNGDDHPALVPYHQGLGGQINDTDLIHGYAYPINNGWRITDYEHKALEDPFVINQVVRRLNHETEPQMRSIASQPAQYDWDRLHYGIPMQMD